jgi:hypothetical protein
VSIVYCSECDNYAKKDIKQNHYYECGCGEHMPELTEDELLVMIISLQNTEWSAVAYDRGIERNYLVRTIDVLKKYSRRELLKWRKKYGWEIDKLKDTKLNYRTPKGEKK